MLAWHHPQPRRKLPPVLEDAGIPDRGHHRGGGDRPDAVDVHQPLRWLHLTRQLRHPAIVGCNPIIQHPHAVGQIGEHLAGQHRQLGRRWPLLRAFIHRLPISTFEGIDKTRVFRQSSPPALTDPPSRVPTLPGP